MRRIKGVSVFLLAFFSTYLISCSNVIVLNLVFYVYIIMVGVDGKKGIRRILLRGQTFIACMAFLGICVVSTVSYSLMPEFGSNIDWRVIIQLLFSMQYILFSVSFVFDWRRYEKYFVLTTVVLSFLQICMFLARGLYRNMPQLYIIPELRMWAQDFIPLWPNTAPLPLLLSVFICLKSRDRWWKVCLLSLGIALSTSRGALLGLGAIYAYFFVRVDCHKMSWLKVIILFIVSIVLIGLATMIVNRVNPGLLARLLLFSDRQDILKNAIGLMADRPLLGYGGRTLEQVSPALAASGYSHLHNWILETAFRYGLFGLATFVYMLVCIFRVLKDNDAKFYFLLLLFLSLFQTFLRNFAIVFFIIYLINYVDDKGVAKPV